MTTATAPDEPGAKMRVATDGDTAVVALAGEVDVETTATLADDLQTRSGNARCIVVDIAEVDFLDSSFLRALLVCRLALDAEGRNLHVRNPTPQARRVFEITNLTALLES